MTITLPERWLGDGLLGDWVSQGRSSALTRLDAACGQILAERTQNWGMFRQAVQRSLASIQERFQTRGWHAPPFDEDYVFGMMDRSTRPKDPEPLVALVKAWMTDYGPRVEQHVRYRMANAGNLHFFFTGSTGIGKSTGAGSLSDWISRIPDDPSWTKRFALDVGEIPAKLPKLMPGETLVMDDLYSLAGEGARTSEALFENLEDTLRFSQVNLFVAAARRREFQSKQATFEGVLWNPSLKATLYLVWLGDQPKGLMALPWMRDGLWANYEPWKATNTKRLMAGLFSDTDWTVRQAGMLTEDERYIEYLCEGTRKPKRKEVVQGMRHFFGAMFTEGQRGALADHVLAFVDDGDRIVKNYGRWFGVEPNAGQLKLHEKWYKE